MTALTSDELYDIRIDIGDTGQLQAFTDAELQRAYDRCAGAKDSLTQGNAARGLLIRQLLASSAKLTNYSQSGTSESLDQVFTHLEKLYAIYKADVDNVLRISGPSIQIAGARSVPRAGRRFPGESRDDEWQ